MAEIDKMTAIKNALSGRSGAVVSYPLMLAIRRYVAWPADAFAVEVADNTVRTLYWLQGKAIGQLTAEGDTDNATLSGVLHSTDEVAGVTLGGTLVDDQRFGPGDVHRALIIRFRSGHELSVDVSACRNEHLRNLTDAFIDAVLSALAGKQLTFVD
ncbi:hypothetical protein ABQF17_17500 [Mycolicibacterium elephantis]